MAKTETAAHATARGNRRRTIRYLLRPQTPGALGSGAEYEFQTLFSTGAITGIADAGLHQVVGAIVGNSQTIDHQTGRSTRGTVTVGLIDKAGTLLRYMSSPTCALRTAIAASGGITQIDCTDASQMLGFPPTGTVLIGSERVRYTGRDNTSGAKKFTGATRAVDGTAAAAHAVNDTVVNGEQLRAGTRVKIFAGDDTLNVADYIQLGRYEILDRQMLDAVTWRLILGDVQLLVVQDAFTTATPEVPFHFAGNPVNLALHLLLSTGTPGTNTTTYDVLAPGIGVAMDKGLVDIAGLEALRDSTFSDVQFEFRVDRTWNVFDWLTTQIWSPLGCVPFVTNAGKYSAKFISPNPTAAQAIDTLTRDDITSWQWHGGDRHVRNVIEVEFDYNLPDAPGAYSTRQRFTAEQSIARYLKRPPLHFALQGIRTVGRLSNGSTYDAPNALVKDTLVTRLFQRWADAKPLLRVSTQYRKHHLEAGDVVTVTHADVPNVLTGARGLTTELMQVLDYTPRFGADAGMEFLLATVNQVAVSTPAVTAGAAVVLQNAITSIAPSGLEIQGQGGDTNFRGPDVTIAWRQTLPPELIASGQPEDDLTLNPRHLDWLVEVLDAGTVRRAVPSSTPAYTYTLADNIADSRRLNGTETPIRTITFRVSERERDGTVGPPATLAVTNPAPDASIGGFAPTITINAGVLKIDWSGHPVTDVDLDRWYVYVGVTNPPTSLFAIVGGGTTYVETSDPTILAAGRTLRVQVVPYDPYGAGTASAVAAATDGAPSMSGFSPTLRAVVNGFEIDWSGWAAPDPNDVTKFEVRIGTANPPTTVLGVFGGDTRKCETTQIAGTLLAPGTTYYVRVIPYDINGSGTSSTIVSGVPLSPADQWGGLFNRVATFDGKVSAEQDGAGAFTNKILWTAGTLRYVDGASVSQSASITTTGSPATWTSGTLYLYYIFGETIFRTTTSITTALAADRIIIAIYAGGSTLHVPVGNFFANGGDVYARTIAANQLVVTQAVITGSAQLDTAVVTRLKILNGEISNSVEMHGSTSWSADGTEREIASAILTTTGGSVYFSAACSNRGPAGDSIEWRIYRDSTLLRGSLFGLYQPSTNDAIHVGLHEIDSPAAGTYIYKVKAVRIGGSGTGTQEAATDTFVLEVRR